MDQVVHEAKLFDHGRRNHEGIEIALAHGAAHAVDRKYEWKPGFEDQLKAAGEVRIDSTPKRAHSHSQAGRLTTGPKNKSPGARSSLGEAGDRVVGRKAPPIRAHRLAPLRLGWRAQDGET